MANTNQILWDLRRADYYQGFLDNILAAIHYDKVNVTGAYGWAIFDNFEWWVWPSARIVRSSIDITQVCRQQSQVWPAICQLHFARAKAKSKHVSVPRMVQVS